jgi:hypothetical protein
MWGSRFIEHCFLDLGTNLTGKHKNQYPEDLGFDSSQYHKDITINGLEMTFSK